MQQWDGEYLVYLGLLILVPGGCILIIVSIILGIMDARKGKSTNAGCIGVALGLFCILLALLLMVYGFLSHP